MLCFLEIYESFDFVIIEQRRHLRSILILHTLFILEIKHAFSCLLSYNPRGGKRNAEELIYFSNKSVLLICIYPLDL